MSKIIRSAVISMSIVSVILGLFGCAGTSESPKHGLSELTSVSVSEAGMEQDGGYSFWIRLEDGNWVFEGECGIDGERVSVTDAKVSGEEREELFSALEENGAVLYAENYKHRKNSSRVSDGDSYGFVLTFSNGDRCVTYERQEYLERYFFRLAEKYGNNN